MPQMVGCVRPWKKHRFHLSWSFKWKRTLDHNVHHAQRNMLQNCWCILWSQHIRAQSLDGWICWPSVFFSFRAFAEFVLLCKTGSVLRPVHPSSLQHTSATTTALAHRHAHALTNKLQILAILKPLNPTNRVSLYQYSKNVPNLHP